MKNLIVGKQTVMAILASVALQCKDKKKILSNATGVNQETNDTSGRSASNEKDEKPSFGARPNTKDPDFNFKKELE